jgi:hypothetical protein
MTRHSPSPASQLKGIYTLHYTLMGFTLALGLFALASLYFNLIAPDLGKDAADFFHYLLYAMSAISLWLGYRAFKRQLPIGRALSLDEKLTRLKLGILLRDGGLQVPAWAGVIASIKTGDSSFLLFTWVMVSFFIVWRPTRQGVVEDLQLSSEEQAMLNQ